MCIDNINMYNNIQYYIYYTILYKIYYSLLIILYKHLYADLNIFKVANYKL